MLKYFRIVMNFPADNIVNIGDWILESTDDRLVWTNVMKIDTYIPWKRRRILCEIVESRLNWW